MLSVNDPCKMVPVWCPVQLLLLQTSHLGHYITLKCLQETWLAVVMGALW